MVQALTKMSHPAELEKVLRGRPIRLMKSRLVLVPFPDLLVSLATDAIRVSWAPIA